MTSPVNEFPDSLFNSIEASLMEAKKSELPLLAAFDADGTLWDTDIGESFFDYQIKHCGLKNLPKDPWQHYRDWKSHDPIGAYIWLAQINQGQTLKQVQTWAEESVAELRPLPIFKSIRRLFDLLKENDVEIYIVTASVKWAVEPAALDLGIDHEHVLGITTEVEKGIVTDCGVRPITWRQGKADGFLNATGGRKPFLANGNTYGDSYLIALATHVALTVSTQNEKNSLYEEELKLRDEARTRGWICHEYRKL